MPSIGIIGGGVHGLTMGHILKTRFKAVDSLKIFEQKSRDIIRKSDRIMALTKKTWERLRPLVPDIETEEHNYPVYYKQDGSTLSETSTKKLYFTSEKNFVNALEPNLSENVVYNTMVTKLGDKSITLNNLPTKKQTNEEITITENKNKEETIQFDRMILCDGYNTVARKHASAVTLPVRMFTGISHV
eukprot:UN31393